MLTRILSLLTIMLAAHPAPAQGNVFFANRVFGLDGRPLLLAPVFVLQGSSPSGAEFLAQLYVSESGVTFRDFRPAGSSRSFQTGEFAGYWNPLTVEIDVVPAGRPLIVQARAWRAADGASFEEAELAGGAYGFSNEIRLSLGEPGTRGAIMDGLVSFYIGIPEPAPSTLLLLALAAALVRTLRRRS